MRPRVTITRRHTGRVYIGMTQEDFEALAWALRFREDPNESHNRLVKAIQAFEQRHNSTRKK